MNNAYYNQLIELLTYKPEGMKVCNIARCIYNSHCTLFDDGHLYRQIHSTVRQYLWKQSKLKNSPFKSVSNQWGVYAITKSFVAQLELCFDNWEYDVIEKRKPQPAPAPQMLNLFDGI